MMMQVCQAKDGCAHSFPLPPGVDTLHLVFDRAAILEHLPVLPDAGCNDEIPEALSECGYPKVVGSLA